MAYTKFGEFMRIMRIKNHEVMGDTAKLLDVTIPFVSAVENGKKSVPASWFNILINHYNLTPEQQDELKSAIDCSKTQIKVDLIKSGSCQREMALQFQRSFDSIDDETAEKIIELLNNRKDN